MPRMDTDIYDALLAAGAPEDKARAAAIAIEERIAENALLRSKQRKRLTEMQREWARRDRR